LACETAGFPHVPMLLAQWLRQNAPDFPFTSISVNYGYAACRHRDRGNFGPFAVTAVGCFEGGRLRYWRGDPGRSVALRELQLRDSELLDLQAAPLSFFDGNCAHEVETFKGERYSIVFFTVYKYAAADETERLDSNLKEFVYSCHPDPRRVWKGGQDDTC
jgi:hypothetical protein